MTPRERAEAPTKADVDLMKRINRGRPIIDGPEGVFIRWDAVMEALAAARAEHVHALLADNVKREIGDALPECYRHWGCIHAFVDALRRKALGE